MRNKKRSRPHTGGLGLEVEPDATAPDLERDAAEALVARAHDVCPYSQATRGNIDVTLTVV
ncbi:MAG: ohr [Acidimicrobiales bacterium]|nr:ohr [Acidimicrobiales bacterium]